MQLKQLLNLATSAALSLLVTGCASIVSGTQQTVKIASSPEAAKVKIEKLTLQQNIVEFEGKTPTTAKLSRKGSYLVTVSLEGYQKAEIPIESGGMNGWVWGNVLFGGLVGIMIDVSNGAANNLKPDEIQVTLVAGQAAQQGGEMYAVLHTAGPDGKVTARAYPLRTAARQ